MRQTPLKLFILLIADLLFIGFCVWFFFHRWLIYCPDKGKTEKCSVQQAVETKRKPLPEPSASLSVLPENDYRNLLFRYRNSRIKEIAIAGDFNQWQPQAMVKKENHTWEITLCLRPGNYSYVFLVDGKPIKDPNNLHSDAEGRSLLVVKPRQ